jgi:hypothetical protein
MFCTAQGIEKNNIHGSKFELGIRKRRLIVFTWSTHKTGLHKVWTEFFVSVVISASYRQSLEGSFINGFSRKSWHLQEKLEPTRVLKTGLRGQRHLAPILPHLLNDFFKFRLYGPSMLAVASLTRITTYYEFPWTSRHLPRNLGHLPRNLGLAYV